MPICESVQTFSRANICCKYRTNDIDEIVENNKPNNNDSPSYCDNK